MLKLTATPLIQQPLPGRVWGLGFDFFTQSPHLTGSGFGIRSLNSEPSSALLLSVAVFGVRFRIEFRSWAWGLIS